MLDTLVTLGMVVRGTLLTMMGLQLRVPVEDLQNSDVATEAAELLPQELAREHRMMPLGLEADGSLRLAVSQPQEREIIAQFASISRRRIRVVLALGGEIDELIERVYRSPTGCGPHNEPVVLQVVLYEGTVNIRTQHTANLQTVVEFVQRLRETRRLRLLRLARQPTNDVHILLALIHRRTACRRPAEETKGCASESGIMVL